MCAADTDLHTYTDNDAEPHTAADPHGNLFGIGNNAGERHTDADAHADELTDLAFASYFDGQPRAYGHSLAVGDAATGHVDQHAAAFAHPHTAGADRGSHDTFAGRLHR
jgi:hypothetical protein